MKKQNFTYQELEKKVVELQNANERLKSLVNSSINDVSIILNSALKNSKNKIFFALDRNYELIYFNNYYKEVIKRIFQVDLDLGMNIFDILDNDEMKIIAKRDYDIAFSGKIHKAIQHYYNDDKQYYFEYEYNPIYDKNGKIIGISAFAINISEQVLAQKTLKSNESKYKTILSNIGNVVGIIDNNCIIKYKSPNIEKIFGWKTEELIGTDTFLHVHTDDLNTVKAFFNRIVKNEITSGVIEFRYQCKNGEYKWVSLQATNKVENSEIKGTLINYRDISDKKEIENNLRESEQTFKALFEKGPIGVAYHKMIYDENGVPVDYLFLDANASYKKLTGINPIGMLVTEAFPGIENEKEPFDWIGTFGDIAKNGKEFRFQQYLESNGRWYDCVGYQHKQDHFVAAFLEITERKEAEIELKRNQIKLRQKNNEYEVLNEELKEKNNEFSALNEEYKAQNEELQLAKEISEQNNRLKTAFLQNMSHEIRTPLNAICGFSGMLNQEDLSNEKRAGFVSVIQNSSDQLLSVVSDILTISSLETQQEPLNISKLSVNNLLLNLISVFKKKADSQNLLLHSKPGLNDTAAEIFSDKNKIFKILTNLLSNALKFTHTGSVEFGYNLKENFLEFYVKDTGIGIEKKIFAHIFERFRQADLSISREYGGTGLGLSISKGFAELLGGKIWVESIVGHGTTFFFTIPYNPVIEKQKIEKTISLNNSKTIMVADDEIYNYILIKELLIDLNLKIIHTKNGKETLKICQQDNSINLILMDIKMPIMNGYEAAKLIKEIKPNLPIIAQTAYALDYEINKYSDVFEDYLIKPIKGIELIKVIKNHLRIDKI